MNSSNRYVFLMNSFPDLGELISDEPLPISRTQLDMKLKMLIEEDQHTLDHIEKALHWDSLVFDLTGKIIIHNTYSLLEKVKDSDLHQIIMNRLEYRTLVKALRYRSKYGEPPESPWGFGKWLHTIEKNWTQPDFGLASVYPWLPQAVTLFDSGQVKALEYFLLDMVWKSLDRSCQGHYFDFEAVVIYVLRWSLRARIATYNAKESLTLFQNLVANAVSQSDQQNV